jgi:hypothetical protein
MLMAPHNILNGKGIEWVAKVTKNELRGKGFRSVL